MNELTIGELRVRADFNASGSDVVTNIKSHEQKMLELWQGPNPPKRKGLMQAMEEMPPPQWMLDQEKGLEMILELMSQPPQ